MDLPDWLSAGDPPKVPTSSEARGLTLAQFDMVLPRVLELVYEGSTLASAIKELPIPIHAGAFLRWLKRNPEKYELYREAKEIRTEAWAGRIVECAEGLNSNGEESMDDVARSKLKIDTYKWLMQSDNRRQYGDVKQVEFGGSISITAALAQANRRIIDVAASEVDDLLDTPSRGSYLLANPDDGDEDN